MRLVINGNDYHYALEQLIRVFYPDEAVQKEYDSPLCDEGEFVLCATKLTGQELEVRISLDFHGCKAAVSRIIRATDTYKAGELTACQMLYDVLHAHTGYTPQWGIQTGVRPTKIYFNLRRNNTEAQAVQYLKEQLYISDEKVHLIEQVCKAEEAVMQSVAQDQFSLYVSIPFCPTRCTYCSFISQAYDSVKKLIPKYVTLLCREIEEASRLTASLGLKLRTVYIGGGTPTVLEAPLLEQLFKTIRNSFNLSTLSEYTLEAGRPDTLNEETLCLIKQYGISRLTINAQSFNDSVLQAVGRKHTAADVENAYRTARKCGFDNINTDLIAGLQGESVESFIQSVKSAIALEAENITIHTLALKRSSFLITRDNAKGRIEADTSQMLSAAYRLLAESGYAPYYMYRQSKSIGNLENTGWAKPGKICEYNIFMMEEVQHVIGVGAGAVSRLVDEHQANIKRVFNYKYPYEYIDHFETILHRKKEAADIIQSFQNLDFTSNKC